MDQQIAQDVSVFTGPRCVRKNTICVQILARMKGSLWLAFPGIVDSRAAHWRWFCFHIGCLQGGHVILGELDCHRNIEFSGST